MICTVYMHYNQLHIVEYRYRLSVSTLICYIISVIGISAKCCIGAPLVMNIRTDRQIDRQNSHTLRICGAHSGSPQS